MMSGRSDASRAGRVPVVAGAVSVAVAGHRFPALVVQPVPVDAGPYPVVAFGHGFAQGPRRYRSILEGLAARGYVVIAPDSQTGLLPRHGRLADDLVGAIRWAQGSLSAADPSRSAVLGHSMGGGAALLAAQRAPWIDAVATCAAADTRPSALPGLRQLDTPALFVVGSQDRIVPPESTRRLYAATASPTTWASITGGSHCGFTDSTSFFGFGCGSGSISRAAQLAITGTLLGDWLDSRLKGASPRPVPAGVVVETRGV